MYQINRSFRSFFRRVIMRVHAATVFTGVTFAAASPAQERCSAAEFAWQTDDGEQVELQYDGRPVLRYMHKPLDESSPEARERTYKPFHHVFSPDGQTRLTKGPGGLYTHHRGLFFGFNRVSYGEGKRCDIWHCTGKTYQSHEGVADSSADENSASHTVEIDWHGQDGEVFAKEYRTLAVRRGENEGEAGWIIDFASRVETVDGQPIHLDGDPQHAGFHMRASQEVAESTADQTYYLRTDGKGKLKETRNWDHNNRGSEMNRECSNRPWNAMSFVVDGQRYTALYLDHPDNPKPSRYSEREYGRFGSYFVYDITDEEPLEVNYRLWIQPGEMTVEQCNSMSADFKKKASEQPAAVGNAALQ